MTIDKKKNIYLICSKKRIIRLRHVHVVVIVPKLKEK